jgi:hypothetical protein
MVAPNNLSVNKTKKEGQHDVEFAEGGDTPMFGSGNREETTTSDSAGPQTAGQTASDAKAKQKFAEGGSSKMFGYNPAIPAKAGITSAR